MSSSRAMDGHGGGYDFEAMNVASSSPVIPSRADGEGPRKHIVTVRLIRSVQLQVRGRRSSHGRGPVLRRIGMTTAFLAE